MKFNYVCIALCVSLRVFWSLLSFNLNFLAPFFSFFVCTFLLPSKASKRFAMVAWYSFVSFYFVFGILCLFFLAFFLYSCFFLRFFAYMSLYGVCSWFFFIEVSLVVSLLLWDHFGRGLGLWTANMKIPSYRFDLRSLVLDLVCFIFVVLSFSYRFLLIVLIHECVLHGKILCNHIAYHLTMASCFSLAIFLNIPQESTLVSLTHTAIFSSVTGNTYLYWSCYIAWKWWSLNLFLHCTMYCCCLDFGLFVVREILPT